MATKANLDDVMDELKQRGFSPKHEGSLVSLNINPESGIALGYAVDPVAAGLKVALTTVKFEASGDDEKEQPTVGVFDAAAEVAEEIENPE